MALSPIYKLAFATMLLASTGSAALAQSPPFAGLAGSWAGAGSIQLSDGSKERLRCRATYHVSNSEARLQQTLRCASDSYRFDLNSDIVSQRGTIGGSWSEASRGVSGSVAGRESGGSITAVVDAPGFTARLSVTTTGNRQSFSISSEGDIRNVSINMTRG